MKLPVSICLIIITVTVCVLAAFYTVAYTTASAARKTADGAISMVKQVLGLIPEATITSYVARQKTTDILELASVTKEFPVEYSFKHVWAGSTKELWLRGEYTVKAGFDLQERFTILVDHETRKVHADFPAPKILSVQQNSYTIISESSGYWAWLNQKDQESAVNNMNQEARKAALELLVLEDAKASLRRQLLQLAKAAGQEWNINFRDEAPMISPQIANHLSE